jgi:lysophospholipase L1-like esterase
MFEGAREKTLQFAKHYSALAGFMKVEFFDAGLVIATEGADGIHFSAKNNADLGNALADKVAEIFRAQSRSCH